MIPTVEVFCIRTNMTAIISIIQQLKLMKMVVILSFSKPNVERMIKIALRYLKEDLI